MRRGLAFMLIVLVPFTGCATHTTMPVPGPGVEAWPLSRTEGAVTIRIDPYFDIQRQKAVFDENLSNEDVLALRVFVHNLGAGRVVLQPSQMAIEFPDGRSVLPSSAAIVAMKVTGGTASVIGSGLVFGGIGFALAWHAREKAKADRIKDYVNKELQTVTVGQNESQHGFVFFIGPPKLAFRDGALTIRLTGAEGGAATVVRLALVQANATSTPRD